MFSLLPTSSLPSLPPFTFPLPYLFNLLFFTFYFLPLASLVPSSPSLPSLSACGFTSYIFFPYSFLSLFSSLYFPLLVSRSCGRPFFLHKLLTFFFFFFLFVFFFLFSLTCFFYYHLSSLSSLILVPFAILFSVTFPAFSS